MIVLVEFILFIKSCLVFQDDDSFRISVSMIYDAANVVEHVDQSTRQYFTQVYIVACVFVFSELVLKHHTILCD